MPVTVKKSRPRAEDRINTASLKTILSYNRETGFFTWLVANTRTSVGDTAGCKGLRGYVIIKINGVSVRAHRLAWFFETGSWPQDEIDHISGETGDNRFANLREANRSQNMANAKLRSNNSSGRKGVHWCNKKKRWIAQIGAGKKRTFLGSYTDKNAASEAYKDAARKYQKEFARI